MHWYSIQGAAAVLPHKDVSWTTEIPSSMKRRAPRIWQMASVAVSRALSAGCLCPRSIIVGTALGALDETKNFLDGVFTDGFGSPTNFIASVHNSMGGRLAQEFKIMGPNLTVCDGANSFASAVALCGVLTDEDFPVVVLAVDEHIELLERLAPHLSPSCQKAFCKGNREGGIAYIIEKKPAAGRPTIRSTGSRYIGRDDPDEAFTHQFINNGDVECRNAPSRAIVAPSDTGGSFLSVPILVNEFLSDGNPGSIVWGSYSPSSRSIAAVEVCG